MNKYFKWVQVSPNQYKTVPLDDERPEVTLPDKEGIPHIATTPPWAALEEAIHDPTATPEQQRQATDAFISERATWTKTSAKYRRFEETRKGEWAKNKPIWRKELNKKDPTLNQS